MIIVSHKVLSCANPDHGRRNVKDLVKSEIKSRRRMLIGECNNNNNNNNIKGLSVSHLPFSREQTLVCSQLVLLKTCMTEKLNKTLGTAVYSPLKLDIYKGSFVFAVCKWALARMCHLSVCLCPGVLCSILVLCFKGDTFLIYCETSHR